MDRAVRITAGLFITLLGAFVFLYVYAHARMVNPDLPPDKRRAQILEKLFLSSGGADLTYIALFIMACGLWVMFARDRKSNTTATQKVGG